MIFKVERNLELQNTGTLKSGNNMRRSEYDYNV